MFEDAYQDLQVTPETLAAATSLVNTLLLAATVGQPQEQLTQIVAAGFVHVAREITAGNSDNETLQKHIVVSSRRINRLQTIIRRLRAEIKNQSSGSKSPPSTV